MADEIKDTNETEDSREKKEDRSFDEEMSDVLDTLDLKSPSEEESEEGEESEEETEESSEGVEEKVSKDQKGGEAEEGELSEEEEELKEVKKIEEEEEEAKGEVEKEEEEEEETTASEEDELEVLRYQNKKLLERLGADPLPLKEEAPKPKPEEERPEPETELKIKEFKGFLKDSDDLDGIIEDREKFEEVLGRVREQSSADANKLVENILTSLPQLVTKHVQRQTIINSALDDFYKANKDLVVVKRVVGEVANEVVAEDPSLSFQEVLDESATRTRKALGFKEVARKTEEKRRVRKPTFKKQIRRSGGGSGPSLTELEADVADTLEL